MKKVLLSGAFAMLALISKAQDVPKNAVKVNPLSLIFATGNFSYERAVSDNQSFQVGFFYTGMSISDIKYSGLGITPEYRFYIAGRKQALNGVYAAPFVRYQNFSIKDKETGDKATFTSFGGGAVLGWEKTWGSGFVLDLFVGPAFNSGTVKVKDGSEEGTFDVAGSVDGFGIRTGITLGFAF